MSNALSGWKGSFTATCYTRIMPDTRLLQYLFKDLCDPLLSALSKASQASAKDLYLPAPVIDLSLSIRQCYRIRDARTLYISVPGTSEVVDLVAYLPGSVLEPVA